MRAPPQSPPPRPPAAPSTSPEQPNRASPAYGRPRRRRSMSFGSSSASASPATTPSPAGTPFHRHLGSVIPFSWEKKPGVPKQNPSIPAISNPLPLPPPLRSTPSPSLRRRRSDARASVDPFSAALAACAKGGGGAAVAAASPAGFGRRVYGFSCKTAGSVADSTVRIPRSSGARTG